MVSYLDQRRKVKREKVYDSSSEPKDGKALLTYLDEDFDAEIESFDVRCLQDMLEESQSESHTDVEGTSDSEAKVHGKGERPSKFWLGNDENLASKTGERTYLLENPMQAETSKANTGHLISSRTHSTISNLKFSILDFGGTESNSFSKCYVEEEMHPGRQSTHSVRCFCSFTSKFLKKHCSNELVPNISFASKRINISSSEKDWSDSNYEKDAHIEFLGKFENAFSILRVTEGPGYSKDADSVVTTLWELLNNKTEVKWGSAKQKLLDQLMNIISTSRKETVVRASVSILSLLISEDKTFIDGIKRKEMHLYYLANALKRSVPEAAIIIYMLKPSPSEIKSLELLPALVDVACNSNSHNEGSIVLPVTPTAAALFMIEILITAFDYVTNDVNLATISSPQILSKFVNVAMNRNLEEGIALTAIFVRCMRLNGNCKRFLSKITPVDPFLHLLRSSVSRARSAALEYFHEILRIPR